MMPSLESDVISPDFMTFLSDIFNKIVQPPNWIKYNFSDGFLRVFKENFLNLRVCKEKCALGGFAKKDLGNKNALHKHEKDAIHPLLIGIHRIVT